MEIIPNVQTTFIISPNATLIPHPSPNLPTLPGNDPTAEERTVLLKLKQQLGNPLSLQSCNSTSSPCDWPEIFCTGNSVTVILLRSKTITQKIPATICYLENLTTLDLGDNFIPGEFPRELYNCTKLQVLDLSSMGPIPDDIDRISCLRFIDFGSNNFSGEIPPAIGRSATPWLDHFVKLPGRVGRLGEG
ncbi:hypothetical protein Dsin_008576 [Dipteronia sinensis]|uniref:Leucine-rich repeat-containing N-terminal plant-type domain-containing protein n=1 Tax=Dipteronia sinensis TaxID=43782 RepID=A0AAE0ANY6_9ROSI|nr:hypothetical protein Dsin_008576 [Dipteronia sinensis]